MTFEQELLNAVQSVLTETELREDEEAVGKAVWSKQSLQCINVCAELLNLLQRSGNTRPDVPPVQVMMFIGGVLGNVKTSEKLHRECRSLEVDTNALLNRLLESWNAPNSRQLLLRQPHPSSQPQADSLALQFLRLCVAQIARAPVEQHEEALNRRPFFRDALLWLAEQLDYPEMAGEEFISVLQPLGLRLTSDYRPQLQLAGLRLLRQLRHKARIADWRQSNRAEALLTQLFDHRIGASPGSSELVLEETYATLRDLIGLLDNKTQRAWWDKLADRLLCDLAMEGRKPKLTALLRHTLAVIQVMRTDFAGHSRRFLHAMSVVLLGPRTPDYLKATLPPDSQDATVHLLMLQCVRHFIRCTWPIVSPNLLPTLLPALIAFVDLEHASAQADAAVQSDRQRVPSDCAQELTHLLTMLIRLEPKTMTDILVPACDLVPALKFYLPASPCT